VRSISILLGACLVSFSILMGAHMITVTLDEVCPEVEGETEFLST